MFEGKSVHECWEILIQTINDTRNRNIPRYEIKSNMKQRPPWMKTNSIR